MVVRTVGGVRKLPLDHPGTADHRSPGRYLWWLAKGQWHTLLLGMFFGIVWMSTQAVMPFVLGRAIDRGIGVTRFTQWDASRGVSTGSAAIARCLSPASTA